MKKILYRRQKKTVLYIITMHEVSLMTNVLELVAQEMEKHKVSRLKSVTLRYGVLSNIVPDSMRFAFEVLTKDSEFSGSALNLVREDLQLKCRYCSHIFTTAQKNYFFVPCPNCHEEGNFEVVKGEGIFLDRIEADE